MKYNTNIDGGTVEGDVSIGQLTVTGFVTLIRSPSEPLEAASKDYIDVKTEAISASRIHSGVFVRARFPGFTGEVTANANTGVLTLPINGITPGWFSKVTPETRGFVAAGGTLSSTDIPALTWNKVRVNAPTTLSGYGITNVVERENATITGTLTLSGNPSENDDSVTKMYVDTRDSTRSPARTGDLLLTHRTDDIAGYLRANGGEADSRVYGDLFNLIRYKYTKRLPKSDGKPWIEQYYFNDEPSSLSSSSVWTRETDLISPGIGFPCLVSTGKYVYTFGGLNGMYPSNVVRRAPILENGTVGTWENLVNSPLAYGLYAMTAFIHNDNIYIVAGTPNGGHGNATVIHWASINQDGTIGAWKTHQNSCFSGFGQKPYVIDGRLYLFFLGNYAWTEFAADGSLPGPWYTGTNNGYNIGYTTTFVIRDSIYAIVKNGSAAILITAKFLPTGGLSQWVPLTGPAGSFPFNLGSSPVFVTKDSVYVMGGAVDSTYDATSHMAKASINPDGTLSGWIYMPNALPFYSSWNQAFVTNSKLYMVGGYIGNGQGQVWSTPISGGLSDYLPVQKLQEHNLTDINNFSLPDYSGTDTNYINSVTAYIPHQSNPTAVQYDFNNAPNTFGTLEAQTLTYPVNIVRPHVFITKNWVYSVAGETGVNAIGAQSYRAPINNDGTIGSWVGIAGFPVVFAGGAVVQYKNRVYILGGANNTAYSTTSCYSAVIDANGNIGSWASARALPSARADGAAIVLGNKLYFFGGAHGSSNNNIWMSVIAADGSLGAWTTQTNFPVALTDGEVFVAGDYIYAAPSNGNDIYRAEISKSDPSTFGSFGLIYQGAGIDSENCFVTKNGIYSLRFADGETRLRIHPIEENGDIGDPVDSPYAIPADITGASIFATSSKIYLIGKGSPYSNAIWVIDKPGGMNDLSDLYFGRFIKERSTMAETVRFNDISKPNVYIKY